MCAYNSVNGVPLCANELLETELRSRMGFEGIVITDCGAIDFMISNHHWKHPNGTAYTPVEATAASLRAGTDLNCGGAYPSNLPTAYQRSLVTTEQIDTAVGRAVYGHMELGLYHDSKAAASDPRRKVSMDVVDSPQHRALARQAAREAVVLLKNQNRTLPLGGTERRSEKMKLNEKSIKIAVVGPNANRTLSLASNYAGCKDKAGGPILASCTFINPLQGIQAAAAKDERFDSGVLFSQGVDIDTNATDGIADAVSTAQAADITIVIGGLITCQETGAQCQEAEARDRSTPVNADGTLNSSSTTDIGYDYGIGLPGRQEALLRTIAESTNTTVVFVIMSGSAVAVPWAAASSRVSSIVQHFYPGVLGGAALAGEYITFNSFKAD